jgi:hypothetical protein
MPCWSSAASVRNQARGLEADLRVTLRNLSQERVRVRYEGYHRQWRGKDDLGAEAGEQSIARAHCDTITEDLPQHEFLRGPLSLSAP